MTISIAMASYNGARFIREQLESFAAQTLLPDELVICDDRSTDDTAEIVSSFAQRAPFPVRYSINSENLGYTRNFERAIARCSGDIIFLSDQDDVWFEDKLATVCAQFSSESAPLVVVNDQIMTDADLRSGGATKLSNLRRLGRSSDGLIEGCCTALDARWVQLVLPIPAEFENLIEQKLLSYDRWLNELAILLDVRLVIEQSLQFFRRHGSNTTNWLGSEPRHVGVADLIMTRVSTVPADAWAGRIDVLDAYSVWVEAMRPVLDVLGPGKVDRALAAIDHERRSHANRIALTTTRMPRRLARIMELLGQGGYRYFYGWRSALRDIVRSRC